MESRPTYSSKIDAIIGRVQHMRTRQSVSDNIVITFCSVCSIRQLQSDMRVVFPITR